MLILMLVAGVIALFIGGTSYVRRAGIEPEVWHVDPLTAPTPDTPNSYRVAPGFAEVPVDAEAPTYAVSAAELALRFDEIALAAPHTQAVAGSAAEGHVTYVQRSPLWGFPDYVSVRFIEADDGAGSSTLAIFSRSRFGRRDLGVNKKRVASWLASLPS